MGVEFTWDVINEIWLHQDNMCQMEQSLKRAGSSVSQDFIFECSMKLRETMNNPTKKKVTKTECYSTKLLTQTIYKVIQSINIAACLRNE